MKHTYYKIYSSSSSIFKELSESTISQKTRWVSFKNFIEYLDLQGIAYDDIRWFYGYLKHIQSVRHLPSQKNTFFAVYDDRVFAISQSKYFREIRMDFTSSLYNQSVWRSVIETQESLLALHSLVQVTSAEDSNNEECENLLLATGCIHA